jgi:solute carrier family 25 thiamine pyrophosphate transporter 19
MKSNKARISSDTTTVASEAKRGDEQCSSHNDDSTSIKAPSSSSSSSDPYHNMIAGAVAGVGARLFTAPLDLWRIRRQLFPEATRQFGLLSGMKHIVQTEGGLTSLFRGNIAATYLWMGYSAVQFSFYEWSATVLAADESSLPPLLQHFVSGAAAGTVATITTYPMDLTRTVFAAKGIHTASETLSKTPFTGSYAPKSILEFVEHILHRHGVRGLFSGCGPAVVQIIPYMGLNFCIHDYLVSWKDQQQQEHNNNQAISAVLSASAGAFSGGVSKIIVFPLDTVKKRLQAQSAFGKMYNSMLDCMMTIARTEGVRSLYNGLVPSVLKNTVATALSFGLFTLTKNTLATLENTDIPPPCFIQEKVTNDSNDSASSAQADQ